MVSVLASSVVDLVYKHVVLKSKCNDWLPRNQDTCVPEEHHVYTQTVVLVS
jgi:hypothetical protein